MVGVEGFEPPITDSESVVLPLDDTPKIKEVNLLINSLLL